MENIIDIRDKRRIHLRGFISLLTALSFLIMTVSGIILFITPQGRIAYWLDWTFWGLSKTQWGDMHITTSLLFALAGLWHTWLNWRALVSYFQDRVKKTMALKTELVAAAVITLFCTVGGIYKTPPLGYILELNDFIKESWVKTPEDEPVISHAELMTLKNFLKKVDIELEPALELLKKEGIKVSGADQKLLDISRNNGRSPAAIYRILKPLEGKPAAGPVPNSAPTAPLAAPVKQEKPVAAATVKASAAEAKWTVELVQEKFEGKGVGRRSLADICQEFGLDQEKIKAKLAGRKITMGSGDTLKKVADEKGELPIEILKIILVGEKIKN